MLDRIKTVDEQELVDGIKIFGIQNSSQYVVTFQGSEFSFTTRKAAEEFAFELAEKRTVFKTSAFDKEVPTTDLKPKPKRAFWRSV